MSAATAEVLLQERWGLTKYIIRGKQQPFKLFDYADGEHWQIKVPSATGPSIRDKLKFLLMTPTIATVTKISYKTHSYKDTEIVYC
jgi:hypothetical protein